MAAVAEGDADDEAVSLLVWFITGGEPLLVHQAVSRVLYLPDAAHRFSEAVETAASQYAGHEERIWFPARQAIEMYRYLYADAPLYYEDDLRYVRPEERRRPW